MDVKHLGERVDDSCRSTLGQLEVVGNLTLLPYLLSDQLLLIGDLARFYVGNEAFFDPTVYVLEMRRSASSLITGAIQMVPMIFPAVAFLA